MKKLLLLGFVTAAVQTNAQFTLTADHVPQLGDTVLWQVASASLSGIEDNTDVGPAGADVTWDFSGFVESPPTGEKDGTMTQYYVDPSTTPNGSSQTLSNVAIKVDEDYSYLKLSTSAVELTGINGTVNVGGSDYDIQGQFTADTDKMLEFPFNYGDTFNDTHSGTGSAFNGVAQVSSNGTRTTTYDGYGTLILPNKTWENVIRVKSTSERQDDVTAFSSPAGTYNSTTETYAWYHADYTRPIVSISFNVTNGDAALDVTYLRTEPPLVDGIENNNGSANTLEVFPNPVKSNGIFQVNGLTPGQTIQIMDLTGSVVWSEKAISTSVTVLPVNMTSGVYFVRAGVSNVTKLVIK